MPWIELTAGPIEYEDTDPENAEGRPVLVFVHGLFMNGTLWRHVVADLRTDFRCVSPTLPLGAHRQPMRSDANLAMAGQLDILEELLDRLDLRDVTLLMSDWGGPQILLAEGRTARIARAVMTSCEAFDNYPPGLPGKVVVIAAAVPGGLNAALQPLRWRPLRRLPITFGWMSKRPVPAAVMDDWLAPALAHKAIRRDVRKYAGDVPSKATFRAWDDQLSTFTGPVLVAWATEDKVMPPEHGRRLADLFPGGRLVEIPDSYTLIPEDNPAALVAAIRPFLQETA